MRRLRFIAGILAAAALTTTERSEASSITSYGAIVLNVLGNDAAAIAGLNGKTDAGAKSTNSTDGAAMQGPIATPTSAKASNSAAGNGGAGQTGDNATPTDAGPTMFGDDSVPPPPDDTNTTTIPDFPSTDNGNTPTNDNTTPIDNDGNPVLVVDGPETDQTGSPNTANTPEPGTMTLMALGALGGLGYSRSRRKR